MSVLLTSGMTTPMSTHTPGPLVNRLLEVARQDAAAANANARLIAAAPDLAEAVRELLATHPAAYREPRKIDNRTDNAIRIARAAIAKAEGVS